MESKFKEIKDRLTRRFGQGVIVTVNYDPIEIIPSGSILLDYALGIGGFPRGRLIEIFGAPSSGKSTLALTTVREAQRMGEVVLWLDYEQSFDASYAQAIGVNFSDSLWVLAQPDTLEQGLQIAEDFVESGAIGLVVVDSLAAMVPKAYLEGDIGEEKRMAEQARVMARSLQRLTNKLAKHKVCMLFLNHVRDVIGGIPSRGVRKTTPGGSALKFYAAVRVELRVADVVRGKIDDPVTGKMVDGPVAVKVKALVVKNKVAVPYRQGGFYMRENGLNEVQTILEIAEGRGFVKRNGSRYILPFKTEKDTLVNLGSLQVCLDWFTDNQDKFELLKLKVVKALSTSISEEVDVVKEEVDVDGIEEAEIIADEVDSIKLLEDVNVEL